jgi:ABC-type multidrug transport system fused ATPase/permease subunit
VRSLGPPGLQDGGELGEFEAPRPAARRQGLDTQLGRELGGVDLSEGQWQRVALARAVMRDEPFLVSEQE